MFKKYIVLITSLFFSASVYAENFNTHCKCSDITVAKLWAADSELFLSQAQQQTSIAKHLPWGIPQNPADADNETLLIQKDYILNHDGDLKTATWAAHRLTRSQVQKSRTRTECFRKDLRLEVAQAGLCADYKEPLFDLGHIVPNSDMKHTLSAMLNTYMISNMAPQRCNFNRGSWVVLEGLVRNWTVDKGKLFVITGAVFDHDVFEGRDPDDDAIRMVSNNDKTRVAVPSHFYKILFHKISDTNIETLSILIPHNDNKLPTSSADKETFYTEHIVTIDEIETMTGITFLPELQTSNPTFANTLKAEHSELWTIDGWPGRLDGNCD